MKCLHRVSAPLFTGEGYQGLPWRDKRRRHCGGASRRAAINGASPVHGLSRGRQPARAGISVSPVIDREPGLDPRAWPAAGGSGANEPHAAVTVPD